MQKIIYIYILSQRYSGSTLLSYLLGTHPEISTIGERRKFYNKIIEPDNFKAQICSCGLNFKDCEYLQDLKKRVLDRFTKKNDGVNPTFFQYFKNKKLNQIARLGFQFYRKNSLPMFLWPLQKTTQQMCDFNQTLVEELLKRDGTTVFLDTSKTIDQVAYLSLISKFDLYVIWLARDPRAQVNSALKYNKWTIQKAAQTWTNEMINNQNLLDELKIKYTTLTYENLCKNPEKEITRLFSFINLNALKFSLDFRKTKQHIIGNSMRLTKDSKIVERKEWKNSLPPDQIKIIEEHTQNYQEFYAE